MQVVNDFLDQMFKLSNEAAVATLTEIVFAVIVSFALGMLISWTYTKTHQSAVYTQSFVHTLVMMGVVVSVIIVVIGSDIAKAFSLAGALSIIRFRSAIRDPKDIAFIFFSMGSGLACGAGLYAHAIVFTIILCILIYIVTILNYGSKMEMLKTLKITIPENLNYEGLFDDIFKEKLTQCNLMGVQSTNLGTMFELTYLIRNKNGVSDKELLDDIRTRNANLKVSITMGQGYIEV